MRDRKGVDPDERKSREDLGGIEWGETIVRIYYARLKKNLSSIKGENKEQNTVLCYLIKVIFIVLFLTLKAKWIIKLNSLEL